LLAERGVSVIHCPESNMKLASGICPVSELLAAGVNVAIGTDGAASNNDLDMFGEMRTAALLAKVAARNAACVPAATALEMATINGARALGLDDRIGSLVPGKSADMVCVTLATPACQPVHNALSQLVYSVSREQVTDVWVAGRSLFSNDTFHTADAIEVMDLARVWKKRMQDI
jgi:5-methylthioadenosine/S-adenosylhomocysteine deaminase